MSNEEMQHSESHDSPSGAERFPELYEELRLLARHYLSMESGRPLSSAELIHEAYLRIANQTKSDFKNQSHVLATAAHMMRRVLLNSARAKATQKRGGHWVRIEFEEDLAMSLEDPVRYIALESAMKRLEQLKPSAASVVEMRFIAGMTTAEIAKHLGYSERWVGKLWAFARGWLREELRT